MRTIDTLTELAELTAATSNVHLRYSAGPDADHAETSRDYESGLPLPGLAALDLDPPPWWTRPASDWLARQICKYDQLSDHDPECYAWLLTGREVGRGPDNEPLLADPVPLGRLGENLLTEASERYHQRFEVGRAH